MHTGLHIDKSMAICKETPPRRLTPSSQPQKKQLCDSIWSFWGLSFWFFFSFFLSPVLMSKHTSVIYPTACTFWPILRTSVLTSNQLLKKWKQCRGPSVWCLLATSLEELISVGSAVVSAQRKMLLNSLFYSFIQQLSYSLSFLSLLHLRRTSLDFF